MANPTITNFDPYDGVRAVENSEQGELTLVGSDTIKRLTLLGRITATGKYGFYNAGNSPAGTNVPVAVLLSEVSETEAGDYPASVLLSGRVDAGKLIIDGSAAGVGITEAIKDQLRTFGIFAEDVTETAALDNQ